MTTKDNEVLLVKDKIKCHVKSELLMMNLFMC